MHADGVDRPHRDVWIVTSMWLTALSPSNRLTRDVINPVERWISLAQCRSGARTAKVPSDERETLVTRAMARPTATFHASVTLLVESGWSRSNVRNAEVTHSWAAIMVA